MPTASRRPVALVATLVLLLTATACAATPPAGSAPESSDSASASPAPTATPTPTSIPTPTQDPSDPSTWLITTAGIGFAQLGDLDDEAISASLSPAFEVSTRCEGLTAYDPADPASALQVFTAVSGSETPEHPGFFRAVGISAPDVAELGPVDGTPHTAAGIGLGSSLAELQAAYPSLETWEDPRGKTPGVTDFVVTDAAGNLVFAVKGDRVITITATFDLPPVGFCS